MISYAQNHEDVVLARALPEPDGFYIDVGAASPVLHSVTKHFYDRGWSGINVEPLADWQEELAAARPRDVNLAVGLSDEPGMLELFDVSATSREESTFDPEVAAALSGRGIAATRRAVEVRTLADVCAEHAGDRTIDLLKVDVEGWEHAVLRGGDWTRFRPRVVLVESTRPGTTIDASGSTRGLLEDAGYACALFDGLNRFYAQAGDTALLEALQVPANVLDDFVPVAEVALRQELDALGRHRDELQQQLTAASAIAGRAEAAEQRAAALEHDLEHLRRVVVQLRADVRADLAAAHREAADARVQMRAAREALEHLLAS